MLSTDRINYKHFRNKMYKSVWMKYEQNLQNIERGITTFWGEQSFKDMNYNFFFFT